MSQKDYKSFYIRFCFLQNKFLKNQLTNTRQSFALLSKNDLINKEVEQRMHGNEER